MSDQSPRNYAPSFTLAKLWAGVSSRGTPRLLGRLGGARLIVLPVNENDGDTDFANPPTHSLLIGQADADAMPPQDYGASCDLCVLEERTSAKGTTYLAGWLSGARIVVVRNPNADPEGPPSYVLRLTGTKQDRPARPAPERLAAPREHQRALPFARRSDRPRQPGPAPMLVDDEVPF